MLAIVIAIHGSYARGSSCRPVPKHICLHSWGEDGALPGLEGHRFAPAPNPNPHSSRPFLFIAIHRLLYCISLIDLMQCTG